MTSVSYRYRIDLTLHFSMSNIFLQIYHNIQSTKRTYNLDSAITCLYIFNLYMYTFTNYSKYLKLIKLSFNLLLYIVYNKNYIQYT